MLTDIFGEYPSLLATGETLAPAAA
jgi:hypothetical protein